MSRTPDTCGHRREVASSQELAPACDFMREVLGDAPAQPFRVGAGVCEACCLTFEPTPQDLNLVVASLLFSEIESRLEDSAASENAASDSLRQLQALCEASLPVLGEDDDDLPQPAFAAAEGVSLGQMRTVLPLPQGQHGKAAQWAVGLTTAPRRLPTLEDSLKQFLTCGWDDVHLFIDGDVLIPDKWREFPSTVRRPQAGAWPNYYLGLQELLHRFPKADVYMMLQDDLEWPTDSPMKDYLNQVLWPGETPCLVSLYCGAEEANSVSGWSVSSHWKWGALAFLFPRELLIRFLADQEVQQHVHRDDGTALVGIDIQIGDWAAREGIPIYRPCPSLVQHRGEISSIWPTSRAVGVRAASRFFLDEIKPQK